MITQADRQLRLKQYAEEKAVIVKSGFLPIEAENFILAVTPDEDHFQDFDAIFESKVFKSMLESRHKWIRALKSKKYNTEQIASTIDHFYRLGGQRSEWSFLKAEYNVPDRSMTDYEMAIKMRARTQIQRMASKQGIRYNQPMKKSWRPIEPKQTGPGYPSV